MQNLCQFQPDHPPSFLHGEELCGLKISAVNAWGCTILPTTPRTFSTLIPELVPSQHIALAPSPHPAPVIQKSTEPSLFA